MVFFEREHTKRGKFGNRELISRKKDSFPRGTVADCKNYFRAGRSSVFRRSFVRHVRDLRISADDLQLANNLLFFRDDLSFIGLELADEFADGFFARFAAVCGDDVAICLLGHADLLEFKNVARTVPIFNEIEPRILCCGRLSPKFHLSRVVLGAFILDGVLLGVDGCDYVHWRVVF